VNKQSSIFHRHRQGRPFERGMRADCGEGGLFPNGEGPGIVKKPGKSEKKEAVAVPVSTSG